MNCIQVTSLDDAMKRLPSSVLPIDGLRRDNSGDLTEDALRTIVDGLKSRGIDPTDPEVNQKLQEDLASFLCSLNNQYKTLLRELIRIQNGGEDMPKKLTEATKEKNITMQDIINVSRHLEGIQGSTSFIEGWQNTQSTPVKTGKEGFFQQLKEDFQSLDGSSISIQKRMVEVTEEKNKIAYNYLGLYGFLNIIAIGLLIYIAAGPKR
jgi:hypothetical protein